MFQNTGGLKQKGIITYGLSANRQNPFAGAAHDAVFNTWRRFSKQVLYVAPPFVFFYYVMNWAIDRYNLLASYTQHEWEC
jgi:ubiquinol-cytochrome c reductase subunit 8